MGTNATIICPICASFPKANIPKSITLKLEDSGRRCIVCGSNCDKPTVLDLFSGQGGAARGYQLAGACVLGVDNSPQPRYAGYRFVQADALTFPLDGYDFIHASPPCQFASEATPMWARENHPNLIPATRERLLAAKVPYVIENVENARSWLRNPVKLCGTMFGLPLWRHRYFETCGFSAWAPYSCNHERRPVMTHAGSNTRRLGPVVVTGTTRRSAANGGRFEFSVEDCRMAMETPWMSRAGLDEAIPPAMTRWLFGQWLWMQ